MAFVADQTREAVWGTLCNLRLGFTQNLKRATDALRSGRGRHPWLASDGFSLSAADPDIQDLPVFCIIHS